MHGTIVPTHCPTLLADFGYTRPGLLRSQLVRDCGARPFVVVYVAFASLFASYLVFPLTPLYLVLRVRFDLVIELCQTLQDRGKQ